MKTFACWDFFSCFWRMENCYLHGAKPASARFLGANPTILPTVVIERETCDVVVRFIRENSQWKVAHTNSHGREGFPLPFQLQQVTSWKWERKCFSPLAWMHTKPEKTRDKLLIIWLGWWWRIMQIVDCGIDEVALPPFDLRNPRLMVVISNVYCRVFKNNGAEWDKSRNFLIMEALDEKFISSKKGKARPSAFVMIINTLGWCDVSIRPGIFRPPLNEQVAGWAMFEEEGKTLAWQSK